MGSQRVIHDWATNIYIICHEQEKNQDVFLSWFILKVDKSMIYLEELSLSQDRDDDMYCQCCDSTSLYSIFYAFSEGVNFMDYFQVAEFSSSSLLKAYKTNSSP